MNSDRFDVAEYYDRDGYVIYWSVLHEQMPKILLKAFNKWIKGQSQPRGGVFVYDLQRFYDQLLEVE